MSRHWIPTVGVSEPPPAHWRARVEPRCRCRILRPTCLPTGCAGTHWPPAPGPGGDLPRRRRRQAATAVPARLTRRLGRATRGTHVPLCRTCRQTSPFFTRSVRAGGPHASGLRRQSSHGPRRDPDAKTTASDNCAAQTAIQRTAAGACTTPAQQFTILRPSAGRRVQSCAAVACTRHRARGASAPSRTASARLTST